MPSHLSDIGFRFSEENFYDEIVETFKALMNGSSREIAVGDKTYLVLYVDEDIEFWLPVEEDGMLDPTAFELHFNTHRWDAIENPSWVSKAHRDMQGIVNLIYKNAICTVNITVPDAICVPELREDEIYRAQIACFAEEFDVYKSEDDFHEEHSNMGTQAIIPIGQFAKMFDDEEQTSRAWFSGIVREIKRKTNSHTKNDYYHLLIESYNENFDVLVASGCVENIEVGDIVSVTAWLSGKIRACHEGTIFQRCTDRRRGTKSRKRWMTYKM